MDTGTGLGDHRCYLGQFRCRVLHLRQGFLTPPDEGIVDRVGNQLLQMGLIRVWLTPAT